MRLILIYLFLSLTLITANAYGQTPELKHFYISPTGNDANTGSSQDAPFKTIQKAIDLALPGDNINLLPGIYHQDIRTKRDGTPSSPIKITGQVDAIVKGEGNSRIFEVNHDYITVSGFTIDGLHGDPNNSSGYRDKLLYAIGTQPLNGVTGLKVMNVTFKNAGGECLRLRYFAQNNEISNSIFTNCGVYDFKYNAGGKNGEAVYIGTAPEQLADGKNPTTDPDSSNFNWIHHNTMNTNGNECVDIKEAASFNIIEYNYCTGQKDPNSAGFDSRGNSNIFRYNKSYTNLGAGIRFGGDTLTEGIGNDAYFNEIYDNQTGGIKFQRIPQGVICGNTMNNNIGGNSVGTYGSQYQPTSPCSNISPGISISPIPTMSPTPIILSPTLTPTTSPITPSPTLNCPLKSAGDANCDGRISLIDFEVWRREFTGMATSTNADYNGDGRVTLVDFEAWRRAFTGGAVLPSPTAPQAIPTSTPTPTSVVMRTPTAIATTTFVATPTSTPLLTLSSNFTCTMVIGYSQVGISPTFISGYGEGWYVAPNYTLNFEKIVGSGTWQLLWDSGHGVDQWQNPSAEGWSKWRNREHPFFDSPCAASSATPDRIIFSISAGYGSDEDAWRRNIEAAITTIIGQIPSVKQLVLQPVVGGPNHETCPCTTQMGSTITGCSYGPNVRASWQHAHIDNAIAKVLDDARNGAFNPGREIISGYSPEVRSCNDYLDGIGHLTIDGAAAVGKLIGQYYAE